MLSYLQLRRAIGWTGITLSPILLTGFYMGYPQCELPPTLSHFYYTAFGTYFTGNLISIAVFLFFYLGQQPIDRIIARLAALCACIVAFCPTSPYCQQCSTCTFITLFPFPLQSFLHYCAAIFLFLLLAFFCLFLFTRTHTDRLPTRQKIWRNRIYRCCGIIILLCLLILGGVEGHVLPGWQILGRWPPLLLAGETIVLTAFGISWLIKGAAWLQDAGE